MGCAVAVVVVALVCIEAVELAFNNLSSSFGGDFSPNVDHATELLSVPDVGPYKNEPSCPQNGMVCICTSGYDADDKVVDYRIVTCKQWHFQVGDVLLARKPADSSLTKNAPSLVIAMVSHSDYIHAGIVTNVPPAGVNQTGDNIFVMEALKGNFKEVKNNSIRNAIQRWPFGGYKIMRPSSTKFPTYYTPATAQQIQSWASQQIGKKFDSEMLKPFKRRFTTGKRFVKLEPDCNERRRALDFYTQGGPEKWICAQLVAWTLAFAGGINRDYGKTADNCDLKEWVFKNLQPNPGELERFSIWDESNYFTVRCPTDKCWVAAPATPDWAGGTLMTSTTSTTLATSTSTTLFTSTSTTTLQTSTSTTSTSARTSTTIVSITVMPNVTGAVGGIIEAAATDVTVSPITN